MVATAFRACPVCGTRNKLTWEACAQCGQPLDEVAVSEPEASPSPQGEPSDGFRLPVRTLFELAAAAGAVWFFLAFHGLAPAKISPDVFSIGTLPSARPSPASTPTPRWVENFNRGRQLLLQGKAAEALKYLADAVAEAPDEPLYHDYYGKALWQTGAREEALREWDAAIALSPSSVEFRRDRARAYVALNRRADAESDYTLALQEQPDDVESLQGLAWLTSDRGDNAAAVGLLQRAVRLRPADPALVQYLAYALEKSGRFEEAEHYYASVLADVPDAQITRSRLAETFFAQNRPDEAIRVLKQGLERTPEAPMLQRALGSLLERSGKVEDAIAAYRAYARLAPNAEDAKDLAARAAALERRLEQPAGP
jgi:Flp pilus assembly protein TadD